MSATIFEDYRLWLVAISTLIGFHNYAYYIKNTLTGIFKPHLFSWLVWTILALTNFAAQWTKDAGPGMFQSAFMGLGVGVIAVISIFKGDKNYTRSDWTALTFSLSAIPLWIITKNPLWSVLFVSLIDLVATIPTIRKGWIRPHQESARAFGVAGFNCGLGFLAISNLTLTTGLYQGMLAALNLSIAAMLILRKRATMQRIA